MNKIDIVICTYNRTIFVNRLISQLKDCCNDFNKIIVVDSSDTSDSKLTENKEITYIMSSRKSQPFQRYLGAKYSESELILFLDDDIEIINKDFLKVIQAGFNKNESIVGVSVGINYKSGIKINISKTNKSSEIKSGKISWLGRTTGLPVINGFVEYFPGPVMAYRKRILSYLFDDYMFLIFEKKISIPEDKAISLRASQFGLLYFFGELDYLSHPPNDSTYFVNESDFVARATFSRLWISKIYAKVKCKNIIIAYLFFFGYFIKQITRGVFSFNFTSIKGNFFGLYYVFKFEIIDLTFKFSKSVGGEKINKIKLFF